MISRNTIDKRSLHNRFVEPMVGVIGTSPAEGEEPCGYAFRLAAAELRRLVAKAYEWDETDVALYMTLRGLMGLNQACMDDDFQSVRMGIPKITGKPALIK